MFIKNSSSRLVAFCLEKRLGVAHHVRACATINAGISAEVEGSGGRRYAHGV